MRLRSTSRGVNSARHSTGVAIVASCTRMSDTCGGTFHTPAGSCQAKPRSPARPISAATSFVVAGTRVFDGG
ncbi:Uncharacterised protein [Clostridium paraputrificum]|nr:Uncharacterised protein [Clostridium paraputrificum]